MRYWFALFLLSFTFAGCCNGRDYDPDDPVNKYWREGYGYNNPNVERIRQGKEPLNFGESEDKYDRKHKLCIHKK